jgi:transposase
MSSETSAQGSSSCRPDINPVENAFAKLKAGFKKIAARTIANLWDAIAKSCQQSHQTTTETSSSTQVTRQIDRKML